MATRPVDEKIVSMKLDNSDFVKKASETTTLLGKIRDSLNKIPGVNLGRTAQDLGAISTAANNTNMNRLSEQIQTVASRFSTMGVIATTALTNITNRAVNAGLALARSLTFDQVNDGFREYELKMGSIGTMLANTEWAGSTLDDVKKTLGELNDYADQTIYNFGEMTSSVGRFTAAGVTLEDSSIAIKGLGNLAAVSGSSSEQLNTAMYQMSQALAAGKLNLMDWNSMVNAGMGGKKTQDALVETAKKMGKNIDLSDGFRNSIEQGWLTSEVFLETLKQFGADESMTKAATSVRTFTQMMASLKEGIGSGWATTWELIFGDFEEATVFWTKMSDSIGGWFSKTADARNELIKGLRDKGGIQNIFDGIANATKPIKQIFGSIRDAFVEVFPPKSVDEIVKMTENFKEFTKGLELSGETTGTVKEIFVAIFSVFKGGIEILGWLGKGLIEVITILGDFGGAISRTVGPAIDWLIDKAKIVGKFLKEAFSGVGGAELLGTGGLVGIVAIAGTIIGQIMGLFNNFGDITDSVVDVFEGVGDAVQNFAMGIKIGNLLLIAIAIGILAASLKTMEGIKTEDLTKGIAALAVSLGVMIGGMMLMDKFNVTGGLKAAATLIALATAVSIMAGALKKMSDLDPEGLSRGIGGLVVITGTLAAAMIAISKWGGKVKTGSLQLVALAGAIYILADAVEKMSKINSTSLLKAVGALGIIFAQLAIFLKVVDKTKLSPGSAVGVLLVAAAVQVMVSAIDKLAGIDAIGLVKGLTSIAIILAQIVIFSKLAGGPNLLVAGAGLLLIAGAINALVPPIQTLGNMSMAELAKGLGAMAIALTAVSLAGLLASGAVGGAIAITIMAGALNLLMIPIQAFANMTWGELLIGLGGLGLSLVVIAGAAMLLNPAIPAMLGFSAALLAMGAAILLAGAGVALFGMGMTALATMTATSIAAMVASFALLLQGFATLIPGVVDFVVKLGIALIKGLRDLIPELVEAVVDIVIKLLKTLTDHLPEFLELGTELVIQLMDGIAEHTPDLVDSGLEMIVELIEGLSDGIRDNGPQLINAVTELLGEILILFIQSGIATVNALLGWIPGVKDATSQIGKNAEKYIRDNFGASQAGSDKGKDFANSLSGKAGDARNAGKNVGQAGKDGADDISLTGIGSAAGGEFATALGAKVSSATSSGKSLANGGKTGAGSVSMYSTGSNFGSGFASGISGAYNSVVSAAKSLARSASNAVKSWLDIRSPSRVMRKDGGYFGEGFALGIIDKTKDVASNAKNLAMTAKDSLNQFIDGFELPAEDNELRFKAVVDYDSLDTSKFGSLAPLAIKPDTSLTNGLITATKTNLSQNGNNTPSGNVDNSTSKVENIYQITVEDKGYKSRGEIRKLAEQIQDELKSINDRTRISTGEEVAF